MDQVPVDLAQEDHQVDLAQVELAGVGLKVDQAQHAKTPLDNAQA